MLQEWDPKVILRLSSRIDLSKITGKSTFLILIIKNAILEIKFKTKLGRILAVAITKIQDIMIKRMNHVSDKIIEYQREVINSLLTFDILQAHLTPAHIQNCCFEDFEYVYRQALSIKEVMWLYF